MFGKLWKSRHRERIAWLTRLLGTDYFIRHAAAARSDLDIVSTIGIFAYNNGLEPCVGFDLKARMERSEG